MRLYGVIERIEGDILLSHLKILMYFKALDSYVFQINKTGQCCYSCNSTGHLVTVVTAGDSAGTAVTN